jgi:hypothetical protein
MPVPSALRGLHLGNRLNADWNSTLLSRIDPNSGGIYPHIIVVLSFQVYERTRDADCRLQSISIPDSRSTVRTYLQQASSAGFPIVIRIMPSPGVFDDHHDLLLATQRPQPADGHCDEGLDQTRPSSRSYDDVGDEIIKIHEWNASHGIFELGFEPANEPNVEWYENVEDGDTNINGTAAWEQMDTYFSAVYDYVHAQYPSPLLRVFTPPMGQGRFAEELSVTKCTEMGLVGYSYMPNVFLNGTKNDGVSWHNYWNEGKENWGDCDENLPLHGQHIAYQFPAAMTISMQEQDKINIITEADLSSPIQDMGNPLADKDIDLGDRAANSLVKFINGEIIAQYAAVWTLNVNQPVVEQPEQNWHEAYCDDSSAPYGARERPWFTLWWTGLLGTPALCTHAFVPSIMNNYTTELIKNGSFDAGGAYWTTTTSQASCRYPQYPYSIFRAIDGNSAAELGRCSANTDTLSQIITIPANVASVNLTYKYRVEQSYSQPIYQDYLYAQVHDYATGEVVTLTTRDDRPPRGTWIGNGIDLTSRRGHNVEIIFKASNNSDLWPAHFWIDDVSVQISQ